MKEKEMTVLFHYNSSNKFISEVMKAFAENKELHGVDVVAVSLEDEFARVEELENEALFGSLSDDEG